jgi:hypothetical protein
MSRNMARKYAALVLFCLCGLSIAFYYRLIVNEWHPLLHGLYTLWPHNLTGQIKERRVVLERCESERQIGLGRVGILERVPERGASVE